MKALFARLGIVDRNSFVKFCLQFVKFGIVGLSNTIISLAIYYLFIWINSDWYLLGNVSGFVVSVANAFFWSRRYVFKDSHESFLRGLLKSYLAYGVSFVFAIGLLFVQVEWIGISKVLAPILNLIITIPLNFLINKYWTFRR